MKRTYLGFLALFCLSGAAGSAMAESCLGLGNCPPSAPGLANSSPAPHAGSQANQTPSCSVVGQWQDASNLATITIAPSLTGTFQNSPYCPAAVWTASIILQGSNAFFVTGTPVGSVDCGGAAPLAFTEAMTFASDCQSASGTYTNADGSSANDFWNRLANQLSLTADKPIIPQDSDVQSHKVLTRSNLSATVANSGLPVAGATVTLKSDRPSDDTITQPITPTDANGKTMAKVETRNQPGPSTITSADTSLQTAQPAVITWFPAHYESDFLVTCYIVSLESDFEGTRLIGPVNGLPAKRKYRQGFINDTRLQGSGIADDGTTIHYSGNGYFSLQSCPLTATGACAVDGTTIAVDFDIVPRRSTVSIDGDSKRVAQDTGGDINGYHIDEYFGTRRSDCNSAGRRTLGVDLVSY